MKAKPYRSGRTPDGQPGLRLPVLMPSLKETLLRKLILEWKWLLVSTLALGALGCSTPPPTPSVAGSHPSNGAVVTRETKEKNIWRSLTTGRDYRVVIQGDRLTANWVDIPLGAAQRGTSIHTVCRREGDKWVGTSEIHIACVVGTGKNSHIANMCNLKLGFEIDAITKFKITGRARTIGRITCKTCEVSKLGWGNFVWVPVG